MVGMTAALIGSAIIGGVGSAVGASRNSRAINNATAAQTTANAEANRIQQEARNQNVAFQTPFYQTGLAATNRVNALLGLNPAQQQPQQNALNPMGQMGGIAQGFGGLGQRGGYMGENTMFDGYGGPMGGQMAMQQPQQSELQQAQQGFSDWRDNTGYQFRFNEGIRAIDAGAPVRNSGATIKARAQYGQGIGSQEYGNYLGALIGQQQVGTGAANALSGVQSNYANNASNLAIQQGQNLGNAAVARANNSNNLIGGLTSSFGNVLGAFAR